MPTAVQTTYNQSPDIGYKGQVIRIDVVESFWSEDGVYPGRAVIKGTDTVVTANQYNDRNIPFGAKLPASGSDVLLGIAILQANLPNDANGEPFYPDQASDNRGPLVSVLKKGEIYAVAGEVTASRDPVYAVYTIGDTGLEIGDLVKDATPGTTGAAVLIPNAYWKGVTAAGKIGIVVLGSDPEA
jgi:hypothetical protein